MAPEILNRINVSNKSDIFSVGCIAYELMTGHQLFKDLDYAKTKKQNSEWDVTCLNLDKGISKLSYE